MPYNESVEEWSEHEPEGWMFPSDYKVNNYGVVVEKGKE